MKKTFLLFILALSINFVACNKEEVKVAEEIKELENSTLRTSNGGTRQYFSRFEGPMNEIHTEGCEYPGNDCFEWVGYMAISNLGDFIFGAPLAGGDPVVIQEYFGDYQTELAPYLHSDLISGVIDGSLNVKKSGSTDEIGDTVYLIFTDSDEAIVSVAPFELEG